MTTSVKVWLGVIVSIGSALLGPVSAQVSQAAPAPSVSQSSLFILDVSGSTNSVELWKNLRVSVISKLSQPFGNPNPKLKKYPVDVSIASVSQNSANSPLFRIVTNNDAKEIWGAIDLVFPKSTDARLERISDQLFGDNGAWTIEARLFNSPKLDPPTPTVCKKSTLNTMNQGTFLRNASEANKIVIANAICDKVIKIGTNLKLVDEYFSKPICDRKAICSDIAGAIYRATSLASDLNTSTGGSSKNTLCVAIASDMLNESPGMSASSVLNSKRVALTSKTLEEAKSSGSRAARSVGIKFPPTVKTRAVMVGIGSGPNPLALERNSFLLAYWEGFWTASGVQQSNQAQSLNQACS